MTLHVYAQKAWHEQATIVGTEAAIKRLRDACNEALASSPGVDEFETTDGEGYTLVVIVTDDDSWWEQFKLPYTDDDAKDRRNWRVIPQQQT